LFAGGAGAILTVLVSWIIAKTSNNREEMKALKDSLDKAIDHLANKDSTLVPRLLDTVDRMATSLRPSVIKAVAPVGKSCNEMRIGDSLPIDRAAADAIRAVAADAVTEERTWLIRITELDLESFSAKVRFEDESEQDDARFRAAITDPAIAVLNNAYTRAFANHTVLRVRGKATLKEGEIQTLYISNTDDQEASQ
jgi:hypothetical protein